MQKFIAKQKQEIWEASTCRIELFLQIKVKATLLLLPTTAILTFIQMSYNCFINSLMPSQNQTDLWFPSKNQMCSLGLFHVTGPGNPSSLKTGSGDLEFSDLQARECWTPWHYIFTKPHPLQTPSLKSPGNSQSTVGQQ